MEDVGGPVSLRRTSSSQSSSWIDSTVHSNINVKLDVNASALSVDATGTVGVLAARKGLYVIDLESPYQPARTLHHQTKWDVTVVKCNPHVLYKGLVASTSNHNTLLWNIDHNISTHIGVLSSHQPLMSTLRAHTRPVSDVAWSPSEPTVLATCSADTTTHLWDIRTPQKPAQSLCAFTTSATQVEWNRLDAVSLATAHDGEVRIWDTRSCEKPTVTITAHMQKIYGLDWSPTHMYELVTCSEDKTVKFWNVMRPRVCQGVVATGAPVWRARYTPFGDGLVTSFHRQDHLIRLWSLSRDASVEPKVVYDFTGHKDLVKGFAWRQAGLQSFQLISWSKNQELRMWRVETAHLEACGMNLAKPVNNLHELTTLADAQTEDDLLSLYHQPTPPPPVSSSSSSHNVPKQHNVVFKFDLAALKSDFTPLPLPASTTMHSTMLPHSVAWDVEEWHTAAAVPVPTDVDADDGTPTTTTASQPLTRREPIRRVSGGCFSGPNRLVYFDSRVAIGQSKVLHSLHHHATTSVPALLLDESLSWTNDDILTMDDMDDMAPHLKDVSTQQQQQGPPNTSTYMDNAHALNLRVHILDCSAVCGGHTQPTDVEASPDRHAKHAAAAGDMELSQMWSILAISLSKDEKEEVTTSGLTTPWSAHPFGAGLVQHVLELYEAAGDVPTLAAIVCALDTAPTPSPTASSPQLLLEAPEDCDRYDGYKHAHADLLYREGAMNARCEMLKHLHTPPEPHVGLTLALYCHLCGRPSSELYCGHCKDFSITCSVCELVVRGHSIFCMNCGHGGHTNHVVDWFATENACPTGCGCWCKQAPGPIEFQIPATPPHLARSYSF
ncbi:Aste57867_2243 [Aphanomyces stellatus]|uniref:Aste57867_2243 protein n=1 Tax=Aphanomyces stellatus TaxID=120398 RepID=A0A485KCT0_9STRA|nr:hypothetical protein As57867_002238 [Aphanomyces stellatus]VFT79446.1 Aste57867_2243 [Aphanomyces stellatus]